MLIRYHPTIKDTERKREEDLYCVFSEVGKSGHGSVHVSDAEGKIEGIAKSYMQKEPSMSYTDALAKAWEDNPDLMDAYDAEEGF